MPGDWRESQGVAIRSLMGICLSHHLQVYYTASWLPSVTEMILVRTMRPVRLDGVGLVLVD